MDLTLLNIRKDKITQFNKKGIYSIEDLVNFLPRKYYDFSNPKDVDSLIVGEVEAFVGIVTNITFNNSILRVSLRDNYNKILVVTFFHCDYLLNTIKKGSTYLVCGNVKKFNVQKNITNPILFTTNINSNLKIYPKYSEIKGMSDKFLLDKMNIALSISTQSDYLEPSLLSKYRLLPLYKAINKIHNPSSLSDINQAQRRLLFDDLFKFNFKLKECQRNSNNITSIKISNFEKTKKLMNSLPFELTDGQRNVLRNITRKMMNGKKVNALVQGDVGSGKTIVAILLMSTLCDNGYQSCLIAPTNILAKQHYNELKERVEPLGIKISFLSSETKVRERKKILKELENGNIDMIVGTHSLFSSNVKFKNLGLVIVDEEHRFGVEQRETLNLNEVHSISMSATPIPRSLALTIYGDDIDVETISVLPKGRKEIKTSIINLDNQGTVYEKILEELKKGHQAYIVCPFVEKSNSESFEDISNVNDEYKKATDFFSKYDYKVGIINGKMKDTDISDELEKFKNKEYDVLVSTTIIEVGVNIPNATVIVIKNAERFGFAQLHQLRGRVGRGNSEAYCYLVTNNNRKFDIFTKTKDGFKIAKEDLLMRGAGSFLGTQQSGTNKYLSLILSNQRLNEYIKKDIKDIFENKDRYDKYSFLLKDDNLIE